MKTMVKTIIILIATCEPPHDKTNKMTCAPKEDSDQPGHPPSLIRVFAVRSMGSWGPNVSSCGQRRLWSDWANAQADLSLRWAYRSLCWFCPEAAHVYSRVGKQWPLVTFVILGHRQKDRQTLVQKHIRVNSKTRGPASCKRSPDTWSWYIF